MSMRTDLLGRLRRLHRGAPRRASRDDGMWSGQNAALPPWAALEPLEARTLIERDSGSRAQRRVFDRQKRGNGQRGHGSGWGVATAKDVDWYKFTLPVAADNSSNIVVNFTGRSGLVHAALYANPSRQGWTVFGTDGAGTETLSLRGQPAGTYYLRVWGGAAVSYQAFITPSAAPAAPAGVTATDGTFFDRVRVTWNAVLAAGGYQVFRNATNTFETATKLTSSDVTGTYFDDMTASVGTTYYYWVVATNPAGSGTASAMARARPVTAGW